MSHSCVKLQMQLLSDALFSSGNSIPGGEDIALRTDSNGRPYLAGSTFKGLLRESLNNLLCWSNEDPASELEALFGSEGSQEENLSRRIIFGDFRLADPNVKTEDCSYLRTFTKLDEGVVETGTLRMAACLSRGLVFHGTLFCHEDDFDQIVEAVSGIQWVGLLRNRGLGRVKITAEKEGQIPIVNITGKGTWLRYRLQLESPMVISLLSQSGSVNEDNNRNFTQSRNYLPGSTVRGMVATYFAREDPRWFEVNKERLLRDVQFANALPVVEGKALIPTPMGFYEDKEQTCFYSVLRQDVQPGHKRAKLGQFCRIEDGQIIPAAPAMETLLRINLSQEDKQLYTVRAMAAGTVLEGYVYTQDPELLPRICEAFREWIWLGGKKYAGCGLCRVLAVEQGEPDCFRYSYSSGDVVPEELYMMLLSATAMVRDAETVGIDETQLAQLLGVSSVEVLRCATSVGNWAGFNRTWGCSDPLITMYEPGSLFRIRCDVAPSAKALRRLEQTGIGTRREAGHGRVLFLKDYTNISGYPKTSDAAFSPSREATVRQARCRWLLTERIPTGLSHSQLGTVQALCESIIAGTGTLEQLHEHLQHNITNRGPHIAKRYEQIRKRILKILDDPLSVTIGCADCDDSINERLRLICQWIDLSRKE